MPNSRQKPIVPNFVPDSGRLVTDRFDFQKHINGTGFNHQAGQIVLSPSITVGSTPYNDIQSVITALAAIVAPPTINPATTSTLGIIQLSGDIAGTATNVVVTQINGKPVSPTGVIPTGQVLTWSGSSWVPQAITATASVTMAGDVTGNSATNIVASLTGNSGTINIASTGSRFSWATTTASPTITQSISSTAFGTAQPISIIAQSNVGTGSTGGSVNLSGGSGTAVGGSINLVAGTGATNGTINNKIGTHLLATWLDQVGTPNTQLSTGIKHLIGYLSTVTNGSATGTNLVVIPSTGLPAVGHSYLVQVAYYGRTTNNNGNTQWGRTSLSIKNSVNSGINATFNTGPDSSTEFGDTVISMGTVSIILDGSNNICVKVSTIGGNIPTDWKFDISIIEN